MQSQERRPTVVRLLILHQMHVTVDQTRQHGGSTKIQYLGALRNPDVVRRSDVHDPITFDQDHLIGQIGSGFGVEEAFGADGYALGRWSLHM
jgi:hypothetical protein